MCVPSAAAADVCVAYTQQRTAARGLNCSCRICVVLSVEAAARSRGRPGSRHCLARIARRNRLPPPKMLTNHASFFP